MVEKINGEYYIKASDMLDWLYKKCETEQTVSNAYRNTCTRMLMQHITEDGDKYHLFSERCFVSNAIARVYADMYDMIVKETAK